MTRDDDGRLLFESLEETRAFIDLHQERTLARLHAHVGHVTKAEVLAMVEATSDELLALSEAHVAHVEQDDP